MDSEFWRAIDDEYQQIPVKDAPLPIQADWAEEHGLKLAVVYIRWCIDNNRQIVSRVVPMHNMAYGTNMPFTLAQEYELRRQRALKNGFPPLEYVQPHHLDRDPGPHHSLGGVE